MTHKNGNAWSIQDALTTYNIDNWGGGYFSVNEEGNVTVSPIQDKGPKIDLHLLLGQIRDRGLRLPLLIRFHDLLRHRVEAINESFRTAITENEYQGRYFGVFPIKVNQLREVVEEIVDAGAPYHFGIEVGSKPELFAAMAVHEDTNSLIICNGYKDRQFVRTALSGIKLGKKVFLVVEKVEELQHIISVSREVGVIPNIGIRVRLASKSAGKWALSGGENAKFGLTTAELLEAIDLLKKEGMEDSFKLVHFHIGSQIPDIGIVKKAVREASRFYAKLRKIGCHIEYLDVGGGLGVDYDGSRTSFDSSTNYSLSEYTSDIVYNIMEICDDEKVPHPHIVSESGRAVTAHHSVLIVDVFGSIQKNASLTPPKKDKDDIKIVQQLFEIRDNLTKRNRRESLHDAKAFKEEAQSMFDLGLLDLTMKSKVEKLYWLIVTEVNALYIGGRVIPEEIRELELTLCDQYVCNFSVFQSLLDHWALGQLFPIVPISRLDEKPSQQGILVDITCDSDGKISKFIDMEDVRDTLPLHAANGKPYQMGIFLGGAYQDIMGDLHNLFGRVNEVHVFLDPDEECGYYIEEIIEGSTIGQVLSMTQYDTNELIRQVKEQVDRAIKEDRVRPSEGMKLLDEYELGLKEYTYLCFDHHGSNGSTGK